MRILVLDAAVGQCLAAMAIDDRIAAQRTERRDTGHEAALPVMAREVLPEDGCDLIAVTVGPGSFTGIRASLALAHGLALGFACPVVGVTVGEAMAEAFPRLGRRALWVMTDSRRGHLFLETGAGIVSVPADGLPMPAGPVAVAGRAALGAAASLAARGANVMLTDARFPAPRHIARVAARRFAGELPPRAAQPVYVDPPEAKLPAGGLRPPPAAA